LNYPGVVITLTTFWLVQFQVVFCPIKSHHTTLPNAADMLAGNRFGGKSPQSLKYNFAAEVAEFRIWGVQ